MKSMLKTVVFVATVAAGNLLLAGCSTTAPGTAGTAKEQAMICTKCEMVWVQRPQTINKTTIYRPHKEMVCPDCTSTVVNFFKTGKFGHTCPTCGDSLKACEAH